MALTATTTIQRGRTTTTGFGVSCCSPVLPYRNIACLRMRDRNLGNPDPAPGQGHVALCILAKDGAAPPLVVDHQGDTFDDSKPGAGRFKHPYIGFIDFTFAPLREVLFLKETFSLYMDQGSRTSRPPLCGQAIHGPYYVWGRVVPLWLFAQSVMPI